MSMTAPPVAVGGSISWHGCMRVEGDLALSRAFGDMHLKKYVTAEPDIRSRRLGPY
jgi:protein phosphatase 1L